MKRNTMNKKHYVRTNITFPPKLLKLINDLVEEGYYQSVSDFVKEASRTHLKTIIPLFYQRREG